LWRLRARYWSLSVGAMLIGATAALVLFSLIVSNLSERNWFLVAAAGMILGLVIRAARFP